MTLAKWCFWQFSVLTVALAAAVANAAQDPPLTDVRIGVSPVMSSAAVFIAVEQGYLRKQGINPVLEPFKASGAKMVPFLATGQLDVGGGNINAGLYNAIANDIPVKIVADKGTVTPGHGYLALLVRKDLVDSGRYKSYADLKGMTMAVTAKGVSQEIVTERYLQQAGLSLQAINLVTLAYQDMNIAFANKSLDAAVQIEPFVATAVAQDLAVRIIGDDAIYPNQQSAVMIYAPQFMEKYPDLAKGFMVAYVQGLRDYNDAFEKGKGRDRVVEILSKYNAIGDKTVFDDVVPVGLHPDGMVDLTSLKSDAQWFVDRGYLQGMPDMDEIVDMRFVEHAKQVLGPYQ
jgi:NitT/TauT family transport system substrate-binding protein